MKTISWSNAITPNEFRIAILELADKHGEHEVLSMILRRMLPSEVQDSLEYLKKEFSN